MAKRIQRKRTKGWRMPEGAVYVGRPSRWGNHYRVGADYDGTPMTADDAVWYFRRFLEKVMPEWIQDARAELRGKDLACWCPLDQPCHADVLLEIANSRPRAVRHGRPGCEETRPR